MEQELGKEKATKLAKYEGVVALTEVQATEIVETIWPRAPKVEKMKAAMICHQYGLNPLMKHVFLIPFKRWENGVVVGVDWATVMGINSNRLIAQRHHNYSYLDLTPRFLTVEEQKKVLGSVDDTRIWAITKIKDMDTGAEVSGIGSWPKDKKPHGEEKGNTKLNMACIHSERQALDRQYPGEMPQDVQVIDEAFAPDVTVVDVGMGENTLDQNRNKESEAERKLDGSAAPKHLAPEPSKEKEAGTAHLREEKTAQKKNAVATATTFESVPAAGAPSATVASIDTTWLGETLTNLKWTPDTAISFLVTRYKVSPEGNLMVILSKLTRTQAEDFVHELQSRLDKQQRLL